VFSSNSLRVGTIELRTGREYSITRALHPRHKPKRSHVFARVFDRGNFAFDTAHAEPPGIRWRHIARSAADAFAAPSASTT
jgi:hypothetical protein